MILSIKDRLLLPELLPESGDIIEMLLRRSITEKIKLTAKEISDYNIKSEKPGFITWDENKAVEKDIHMEDAEINLIKKGYAEADKAKKITERLLDLCLKIRDL